MHAELKVLTSALLSRLLLGRIIPLTKWRALAVLVLGVVLIVHQSNAAGACAGPQARGPEPAAGGTSVPPNHHHHGARGGHGAPPPAPEAPLQTLRLLGTVARSGRASSALSYAIGAGELLAQTTMSAFVGVFLERYLKRDAMALSIWQVNVQLAAWSACAYALLCLGASGGASSGGGGLFHGWSGVTVAVAAVSALGGVLVALCLRYTDSVLKNLPAACSVALVASFSALFLGGPATLPTAIGAVLVVIAILDYSAPSTPPAASPRSHACAPAAPSTEAREPKAV